MDKWCEHCEIKIGSDGVYKNSAYSYGWKFCPICGTPRPADKTLAEKIRWLDHDSEACKRVFSYTDIANCALEHFLKIVDTRVDWISNGQHSHINVEKLKDAMKESVK